VNTNQEPFLVSAIVSAYNAELYLRDCLTDLLRQTIADKLEIVVVDSGSQENEREIVAEFMARHRNIVYVRSEQRETVYAAWNRGIKIARGKYLTNANTDDRHRQDALEVLARTLDQNPRIALVYADCLSTRSGGETFETARQVAVLNWLDFNRHDLWQKGCFVGPQPMWRREVHDEHGYFDATCVSAGDYEFWMRIARTTEFLRVKEVLGLYLDSPTSVEHVNRERGAKEIALAHARYNDLLKLPATGPVKSSSPVATIKAKPVSLPPCALQGQLGEARRFFEQKKLPAAWGATRAALKHRPFHPEAYLLLAEIALAAQDSVAARDCAQFARHIAPEFRPAKKFLKGRLYGNLKPEWLVLPEEIAKHKSEGRHHLSVCLIVKNEARFLGRCLASVKGLAHQIVVVDTGSTDRTVEIAREHGAQVHSFAWCDDFSAARNAAMEHVTGDWVLMLDADEELPVEQHAALRKLLRVEEVISWRLPLQDVGREAEGCSYVPRLFRNAPGLYYVGRVHEQVFTSIEVHRQEWGLETRLGDTTLRHYGYTKELTLERDKVGRNLRLLEQAVLEMPGDPNLLMNFGLELTRSGRQAEGLCQYRAAFEAMAAAPAALVVPESREMLLVQFCAQLMAVKRYAEVVQVLGSPLAGLGGGLTASLHFSLGLAQMELKQFAAAAEAFRQCLAKRDRPALTPVNQEIHKAGPRHCLARCLDQMGETDAAAEEFRLALETEPQARPVRLDYARFLAAHQQQVEALNLLFGLAGEQPGEAEVWLQGGRLALTQPEFLEVALDWTAEAERHLPDVPAVVQQRAEALTLAGQCDAALPLWRRWPPASNHALAAALVVCETAVGESRFSPAAAAEVAVSREFVAWYQRLLQFDARPTVETLNTNIERLERVLPSAAGLLASALAEATETVTA
jgi:glycosyltransferase involved in cell wall biosynthesis/tetratricopeptide (TPR) repeat protein